MALKLPKLENASLLRAVMFPAPQSTYDASFPDLFYISKLTMRATTETKNSVPSLLISRTDSSKYVVYSHGNATDIGSCRYILLRYSNLMDANVLAYEYPGYGVTQHNQEITTADGIRENVECAYTYLLNDGVVAEDIIFLGRSIGSGPSCHAALELQKLAVEHNHQLGGLILISPYTSINGIACSLVPYLGWLCPHVFNNVYLISRAEMQRVPVMFIHGEDDKVIPASHSQELYDRCTAKQKRMIIVESAGHNFDESNVSITTVISQFFDKNNRHLQYSSLLDIYIVSACGTVTFLS